MTDETPKQETIPYAASLAAASGPVPSAPARSQWFDVWRQFTHHKGAMLGGAVFVAMVLVVFAGPLVWTVDPTLIDIRARNSKTMFSCLFTGFDTIASCFADPKAAGLKASWAHPLGADQLGRDTLARMIAGGQTSLSVGIAAMTLSLILGSLFGVMAGYFRRLDGPLMRLTDLFLALPLLPLLLVMVLLFREPLSGAFGAETGIFILIVVAIGITSWMPAARIVRGEVLALKEREFVLAARSIGTTNTKMILRHILPNVVSPIMVSATLGIANAIITESALSFLGLGFPPDFPTWGRLLFDSIDYMQQNPERVVLPGVAISLTVLSVNYLGDGLRDALDPRLRGR